MHDTALEDRLLIREVIEDWVIFRDSADWERFAGVWLPDGFIMTTWCEATGEEFIARGRKAFEGGMNSFHTVNGSHIELDGERAFALTKMQIIQRAPVHGVLADVTCQGRFCDAFEKRDGRWGLLSRQAIYEGDRIATVEPGAKLELDPELLAVFPEGYRHLGYLQTQAGLPVNRNLPCTRGQETVDLLARMRRWLAGGERELVRSAAAPP